MLVSARERAFAAFLCALALGVVAGLDLATGADLGFFVFYFVPVALAAWSLGALPALAVACAAAALWYGIDSRVGSQASSLRAWNAGMRLASFVTIAFALATIRSALTRERRLNAELSDALGRIKRLRGLVPICGSCKSIRNDRGYWEELEAYIEKHSDAEFSHGICPRCLERLVQDLDGKEAQRSAPGAVPRGGGG